MIKIVEYVVLALVTCLLVGLSVGAVWLNLFSKDSPQAEEPEL